MRVPQGKQQLEQLQPAVGDAPPEFSAHRSGKEGASNNTSRHETKGREGGRGREAGEHGNGNYSLCARKYMEALHASKKDGYTRIESQAHIYLSIYTEKDGYTRIESEAHIYLSIYRERRCTRASRTGIPALFMYIIYYILYIYYIYIYIYYMYICI